MWDERYGQEGFVYGQEPNDFLRTEAHRIPPGGRVLCLAEGEGRNAVFLAELGYDVTAVDQSAVGLRKAEQLAASRGVSIETVVADLTDWSLGTGWDGIVSIWAHLPREVRQRLHAAVVDGLAPGGVLILEAYTPRQPEMPGRGGPPASRRDAFMSLTDLRDELVGLDLPVAREVERDVQEGWGHQGSSSVVQIVARRS